MPPITKPLAPPARIEAPPPARQDGPPHERARSQGAARVLLVLALSALGLWILHGFLPALAWALVLAIALWPLYARLEHRFPPGKHNILLPTLMTAAVALVFLAPLAILGVQAAREAHDVADFVRNAEANGVPAPEFLQHLPYAAAQATDWWNNNLGHAQAGSDLLHRFQNNSVLGASRNFGREVVHRIVLFGFSLVALFFLFRDWRTVRDESLTACHRLFGPRGERVARQMVASVHGTVDGLVPGRPRRGVHPRDRLLLRRRAAPGPARRLHGGGRDDPVRRRPGHRHRGPPPGGGRARRRPPSWWRWPDSSSPSRPITSFDPR